MAFTIMIWFWNFWTKKYYFLPDDGILRLSVFFMCLGTEKSYSVVDVVSPRLYIKITGVYIFSLNSHLKNATRRMTSLSCSCAPPPPRLQFYFHKNSLLIFKKYGMNVTPYFLQALIPKKFWGESATGAILYDPKVLKWCTLIDSGAITEMFF